MSKDIFIHKDVEFKIDPILGDHIAIDKGVYCTVNATIGGYTHISPYVTIIGGKTGEFICKGFNNIMAGARIICGSDRFDDSGLFGTLIPEKLKKSLCQTLCYFMNLSLKTLLILILKIIFQNAQIMIGKKLINF